MNKEEVMALKTIFEVFNDKLDEILTHVNSADLNWFTNLAVQEWYSRLKEIIVGREKPE